jgi:hypothetical protein
MRQWTYATQRPNSVEFKYVPDIWRLTRDEQPNLMSYLVSWSDAPLCLNLQGKAVQEEFFLESLTLKAVAFRNFENYSPSVTAPSLKASIWTLCAIFSVHKLGPLGCSTSEMLKVWILCNKVGFHTAEVGP